METDFFSRLRLLSIPSWSKYFFFVMLIIIGIVNTLVFSYGFVEQEDNLVDTTMRFLAVLLPIFTIFYVLIYIRGGETSILHNVELLFRKTVPQALEKIEDEDFTFYDPGKSDTIKPRSTQVKVYTNYRKGEIYADFMIVFKGELKKLPIRLEINYRRINFNLYLSLPTIAGLLKKAAISATDIDNENAVITGAVVSALGHTLEGARYTDERAFADDGNERQYQSGYLFNREMIYRRLEGRDYMCIVGMKSVSANFIMDASEKYYFSVDLMLMMRAMVSEFPAIKLDMPNTSSAAYS